MSNSPLLKKEILALSVARWFDPFVSVAITVGVFFALYKTSISDVHLTLLMIVPSTVYLFFSELTRQQWSWHNRPQQPLGQVLDRTLTKYLGVLLGILACLFLIWLFPAYHNHINNMARLQQAIIPSLAFILPVSLILIFFTEYILGEKRDGTYQFGLITRGKINEVNWRIFFDGVFEWLLRFFFLQINFYGASWYVMNIRNKGIPSLTWDFPTFITQLDLAIFGLIVFSIIPGYLFASRLINTDLKKVDRTWFGWAINLSCYPPLNAAVFGAWMQYMPRGELAQIYAGTPPWAYLTDNYPWLLAFMAFGVIFFALIHLWGEAAVGIRAANMSQRGLITSGLFRLTRHPIYVSKGFQWAFIYVPFLNILGVLNSIQSAILFALVLAVYYGRALSEERLLATDPNYVKYALYMDDHSMFAFIGRWFPIFTFRWKYDYWVRNNLLQPVSKI